jgi:hypothetical protein
MTYYRKRLSISFLEERKHSTLAMGKEQKKKKEKEEKKESDDQFPIFTGSLKTHHVEICVNQILRKISINYIKLE